MTIWPPKPGDLRRPAWRSLVEAAEAAIDAGALEPGDRLPTHRRLAADLGLGVQTVGRAYDELTRRGRVRGEIGRGTFVRAPFAEARTPFVAERSGGDVIDLSMLKPVPDPAQQAALQGALRAIADDMPGSAVASFRPSTVQDEAAAATRRWLALCGLDPDPGRVVLTGGSTPAMTVALMTAASPGGLVATEEVGHHTLKPLARYLGLRLAGVAVDGEGMRPDALDALCVREAVTAIYLMPTATNPLSFTMGRARREAVVAVARRHGLLIVENDAWGPLQSERPAPFAALAPELTFWFTSFTKCLMPGLRVGHLVVPERFEGAARNRHLVTAWTLTPLMSEIAARLVADGTAEALMLRQRAAFRERADRARRVLDGRAVRVAREGMHAWIPLPDAWAEEAFVAHARRHGLAVAPGSSFAIDEATRHRGIRLALGAEEAGAVARGLGIVARLLRSEPEPALLV